MQATIRFTIFAESGLNCEKTPSRFSALFTKAHKVYAASSEHRCAVSLIAFNLLTQIPRKLTLPTKSLNISVLGFSADVVRIRNYKSDPDIVFKLVSDRTSMRLATSSLNIIR